LRNTNKKGEEKKNPFIVKNMKKKSKRRGKILTFEDVFVILKFDETVQGFVTFVELKSGVDNTTRGVSNKRGNEI